MDSTSKRPVRILVVVAIVTLVGAFILSSRQTSASGSLLFQGAPCPPAEAKATVSMSLANADGDDLGEGQGTFTEAQAGCVVTFDFSVKKAKTYDATITIGSTSGKGSQELGAIETDQIGHFEIPIAAPPQQDASVPSGSQPAVPTTPPG